MWERGCALGPTWSTSTRESNADFPFRRCYQSITTKSSNLHYPHGGSAHGPHASSFQIQASSKDGIQCFHMKESRSCRPPSVYSGGADAFGSYQDPQDLKRNENINLSFNHRLHHTLHAACHHIPSFSTASSRAGLPQSRATMSSSGALCQESQGSS